GSILLPGRPPAAQVSGLAAIDPHRDGGSELPARFEIPAKRPFESPAVESRDARLQRTAHSRTLPTAQRGLSPPPAAVGVAPSVAGAPCADGRAAFRACSRWYSSASRHCSGDRRDLSSVSRSEAAVNPASAAD